MKITSIIKQKYNEDRYNISIDGVFAFSASLEDILKYSIEENLELDRERIDYLIRQCEATKAFKYSLYLIERKDYTTKEIENKLLLKEYSELTVKEVIDKLSKLGFIDDNRYTERFVRDRLHLKKYGKRKILHELTMKGLSRETMDEIEIEEDVEYNNARSLAEKKYNQIKEKNNVKDKLFRFLAGRGYEFNLIKRVVNEIVKNQEEDYGSY